MPILVRNRFPDHAYCRRLPHRIYRKAVAEIRQKTDIANILPDSLSLALRRAIASGPGDLYELRLIRGRGAFAVTSQGILFLQANGALTREPGPAPVVVTAEELEEILRRAVGYSGFAHEEELRQCFLTRGDGTRIGIAFGGAGGTLGAGGVNSLNIRFPLAPTDLPENVPAALLKDLRGGLLIAGAPNTGKTTLLRACCRYLGDGLDGQNRKVCAVDERMELAGEGGVFDLGRCTDVIAGRSKHEAILTALRLLSPEVIVCDEIGSYRETESILEGLNGGVHFIATMHAGDLSELTRRSQFLRLFGENVFARVALLDPAQKGVIHAVYSHEEVENEIRRGRGSLLRGGAGRCLCELAASPTGDPAAQAV